MSEIIIDGLTEAAREVAETLRDIIAAQTQEDPVKALRIFGGGPIATIRLQEYLLTLQGNPVLPLYRFEIENN
ncbi:MAG: hypothetical protein HYT16_02945 [DPANN group archaeon]|nr:hypothetical protein [DPANN group archaeon]